MGKRISILLLVTLFWVGCEGVHTWEKSATANGFATLFPQKPEVSSRKFDYRMPPTFQSDSSRIQEEGDSRYVVVPVKEDTAVLLLRKETSDSEPKLFTSEDGNKEEILKQTIEPAGTYPSQVILMSLYVWEFPADVQENTLTHLVQTRYPVAIAPGKLVDIPATGKKWWAVDTAYRTKESMSSARFEYERCFVKDNKAYLARIVGPVTPEWRTAFFDNLEIPK